MARHRWLTFGGMGLLLLAVFAAAVVFTARPDVFKAMSGAGQCHAAGEIQTAVAPLAEGAMAAFTTVDPVDITNLPFDGRDEAARTIADLKGRTTLLNLWATWCAPCRVEMPELAALHTAFSSPDFAVVAVSIDNRDANKPENFLTETGADVLDYHREPTLTLFNSLRAAGLAQGMPTTLLLGPDGCVAGVVHGYASWNAPQAHRLIRTAVEAGS
ncbi:MAG: TlpA disulfide reductase family protein [Pseudomonadota bacterium]